MAKAGPAWPDVHDRARGPSRIERSRSPAGRSVRERIRPQLKAHDQRAGQRLTGRARARCVDALDVHRRAVARGHPQPLALPPGRGSARPRAGGWDSIAPRQRGVGRIGAGLERQDVTGVADVRSPDASADRAVADAVEAEPDARVLRGICRLVWLDRRVALAVSIRVDDERRPALRLPGVARLPEHLRVDPADDSELVL